MSTSGKRSEGQLGSLTLIKPCSGVQDHLQLHLRGRVAIVRGIYLGRKSAKIKYAPTAALAGHTLSTGIADCPEDSPVPAMPLVQTGTGFRRLVSPLYPVCLFL
jgi:hypothetical protein